MATEDGIPQRDKEAPKEKYLNKYVRDKVCGASEPRKWRDLGIELLGDDDNIAELDARTYNMSEKQCCSVMFKFWLERQPQATWRQLIDALYVLKLNRVANDVENLLIQSKSGKSQQLSQKDGDKSITRKYRGHELARLNGRYANIVVKIKDVIKQKGFNIMELLLNLNNIDTDNSTIFSTDAASKITKIDDLFIEIAKCCNIYNYDLLIALLSSIECKEATEILDDFTKELQNSVLQELDLLSEIEEPLDPLPRTHKLVIKYTGDRCTFEMEKSIRSTICNCFHLKTWSVTFNCVQDGCIALVYQISSSVKSHLLQYKTTADDATFIRESHIKHIIIDDKILKIPSILIDDEISMIPSPLLSIIHKGLKIIVIVMLIALILGLVWLNFYTYRNQNGALIELFELQDTIELLDKTYASQNKELEIILAYKNKQVFKLQDNIRSLNRVIDQILMNEDEESNEVFKHQNVAQDISRKVKILGDDIQQLEAQVKQHHSQHNPMYQKTLNNQSYEIILFELNVIFLFVIIISIISVLCFCYICGIGRDQRLIYAIIEKWKSVKGKLKLKML